MEGIISTGNSLSQTEIFPLEMLHAINGLVKCRMGKKRTPREGDPIYVMPWVKACGFKQKHAIEGTRYSQGYFSNLGRGAKGGPSGDFVRELAKFLDVGMDDLYELPPPPAQVEAIRRFWRQTRRPDRKAKKR